MDKIKSMTNLETAVLGLIAEKPMYGYEIEKVIEERGMRNWTNIGFSSIYSALKKLEREGLILSKIKYKGVAPPKKIYKITEDGKRKLKREIKKLLSNPKRPIHEFDLGIANVPILSKEEILECLNIYLENLDKHISFLENSIKNLEGEVPFFVIALFERPMIHSKKEKEWVLRFLEMVKREVKP